MQFQESDLVPLKAALLSGVKTVSIQGRTVTFHDLRDLKNLIREIEENIAAQATPSEVPETARTIQARFKIK